MKLQELQEQLSEKEFSATYKKISNDTVKQERVYLNVNKQYQVFFIDFEDKPFLKVYIKRPEGFDFKNIKQSELETEMCKKAKFQILKLIRNQQVEIKNLEAYEKWEDVLIAPKSGKKKIEIII
ncbi:MAG: hypothetical protein C0175_03915 [Caldisericum exile]|uniref:Uncharacterized protein n=1 Tax=Caldisericum exile TaxID=693075 RepID=A0A2J6X6B1_9BACT|nr:MAG: hypothetical protein C0175_03915 [Caldisericum exile]